MANEVQIKDTAEAAFTITLASLANDTARSSLAVTNSDDQPAAWVSVKLTSGAAAPTVDKAYIVYLLRDMGTIAEDGWGGTDAAITIENAPVLGTIIVTANAAKAFYGIFDTSSLGPLGPTWGIAIKNVSDQTISTTEGDHAAFYNYYVPEIQD